MATLRQKILKNIIFLQYESWWQFWPNKSYQQLKTAPAGGGYRWDGGGGGWWVEWVGGGGGWVGGWGVWVGGVGGWVINSLAGWG